MDRTKSPLAGKRILVVEDEFLLALDISESLEEWGAQVVGPAYDVDSALALAKSERLDGAMLDVNINGVSSLCVAAALQARGIPILCATGYGAAPPGWPDGPVVDKPYNAAQVGNTLLELFGEAPTLESGT
jgi:CheY-like chemotaxis protein